MASFFKKSLAAQNIRVTIPRGGNSSFEDTSMDDEYERRAYGGQGPRTAPRGSRGGRGYNRGRGNNRSNRFDAFNQHDDRDDREHKSVTERLGERMGFKGRGRDRQGRRRPGGNRNQPRNSDRHNNQNEQTTSKLPTWYQVTIPYGRKAEKEWIFKEINELLDTIPFIPTSFRYEGQAAIFYVEMSFTSIEALRAINKRIVMPNGFKMMLQIQQKDPPVPKTIEGELLEKLVTVMSQLYDTEMEMLDLSSFHKNEGLKPEVLPLNRNSVMTTVVNVIGEHIPEVKAINLSNNRLSNLHLLSSLVEKAPHVQGLDLSNNELRISELEKLKDWKVKELKLSGTPIAKQYSNNRPDYLTCVRKRFPSIVMLDDIEAPPAIGFDIENVESKKPLPPRVDNFSDDGGNLQQLILDFIQQYITVFDSKERTQLLDAYHDDAKFSCSFWFWPDDDRQNRFDIHNSRNLLRVSTKPEERSKRMHISSGVIVNYFATEFPYTKHLMETLNMDLMHHNSDLMCFTLTGLFEEPNPTKAHKITRIFSRTFTVVPHPTNGSLSIIDEQFSITNASNNKRSQIVSSAKQRLENPAPVVPVPASSGVAEVVVPAASGLSKEQETLLQRFMGESGMNAFWSKECLVQNNWDYAAAGVMYTNLKGEGKIPADAFL